MELRQLRYFIALADEGSFTRAAQSANVAQPALSRQIQKLENELGLPLVDRTPRHVAITPAGQEVAAAGRRVLGELDALKHSLQQTTNLLQGTVTIGVTQTPDPWTSRGSSRRSAVATAAWSSFCVRGSA